MEEHLLAHYAFYGEFMGVRTARKHIGWYVQDLIEGEEFRQQMNKIESCELQLKAVHDFFDSRQHERLQYRPTLQIDQAWKHNSLLDLTEKQAA
jgi:tRNA-dihydrouridine synthase B